jgi:hypothetical protein
MIGHTSRVACPCGCSMMALTFPRVVSIVTAVRLPPLRSLKSLLGSRRFAIQERRFDRRISYRTCGQLHDADREREPFHTVTSSWRLPRAHAPRLLIINHTFPEAASARSAIRNLLRICPSSTKAATPRTRSESKEEDLITFGG